MNEITRIHIAKHPYDIEVPAKKELESYIKKLELYGSDDNLMEDIEIRMTEILAERNIASNGLISRDDVAAIKEQLGEPKEFWGEGDIAVGPEAIDDLVDRPRRRLYRDLDGAVLGGILAGIAKYLDISPIWTRIIFLILTAVSFGALVIVYALLWIIIPPARTAAEKLESSGRPITLASIKEVSEDESENHVAPVLQSVLRVLIGLGLVVAGLGALAMIVLAWFEYSGHMWFARGYEAGAWQTWLALGLLSAGGLLFVTLMALLASAIFKKKWTKRFTLATIVIVASGLLIFGGGAGTVIFGAWQQDQIANNSRTIERAVLDSKFKSVTKLAVDTSITSTQNGSMPVTVTYIVAKGTPRFEMVSSNNSVEPVVTYAGTTAMLTVKAKNSDRLYYVQPNLTIYGPALTDITATTGVVEYHNGDSQDSLNITTLGKPDQSSQNGSYNNVGSLSLYGTYKNVTVTTGLGSTASLDQATIENLTANLTSGYISAGVVRTLTATVPDVCPTDNNDISQNRVVVKNVSSGTMTYNGKERSAGTVTSDCGTLIIGSEEQYDEAHPSYND